MPEFGFARSLAWVRDGSALLRGAVVGLSAQAVHTPSPLPGWTRAHVLTHLARNADALANLLTWARTGVETPMYPDPAGRLDDIERGARRPATDVVEDVLSADDRLLNALDALPAAAWQATVRSALGRTIPASEVPWMRTRELWVHAVDLATDAPGDFDAFPPDLVDALLTDACATVGGKEGCPALVLRPDDRDRSWLLSGPEQLAEEVRGPATALCAWLLGRDTASARKVSSSTTVSLPKWL
ncbi:maleylpyruvate isomerase family mycothiol-dependent enzyme [Streptomyces sp. NPDC005318]|uniref:maleylpyruvate isomerase family mycothiol-dependent enzyme n=1 Tax=Streptomyces sp. NPDC005318 TaxID=3157031 RepID=UPI0033AB2341